MINYIIVKLKSRTFLLDLILVIGLTCSKFQCEVVDATIFLDLNSSLLKICVRNPHILVIKAFLTKTIAEQNAR